ncbi:copper transporter [Rhizomonospora bruguierae]|uniref:copper transporter n=1 Tax=Rhizomonospora bruguierae TaxID=1581705 RepID=UPI001BCFC7A0|nr:copper transporter [Micromonospora sp. NBRC 107566]
MINFRYHVVSLTAVFLALAIGLVVGTAALNGPISDSLSDKVNSLSKEKSELRDRLTSTENELNRREDFAVQAAPRLLGNTLANHRVLLLVLPGAKEYVDGVMEMLKIAGATVTGRVDVLDKLTNPGNNEDLLALADQSLPPSVPGAELPANSKGVETSGALLAGVLMDRPGTPVPPGDQLSVLTAYSSAGFISVTGAKVGGPAEAVVIVGSGPYKDRDAGGKNEAVVTLVEQFDKAGPVVVAGTDGGEGNVISAVRGDPALSKTISTVDNVPTSQGRVVTVMAITEQLVQKKVGHYGAGSGATALMPK